jgi:hypothetical protein
MALPAQILEAGAAVEQDISIGRGESPRLRLELIDDDTGAVIDTTGITANEVRIYDAQGDALLMTLAGTAESPTSTGQLYADMTAIQSATLPFTPDADTSQQDLRARFAWWVSAAGAQARVVARGRINVVSDLDP